MYLDLGRDLHLYLSGPLKRLAYSRIDLLCCSVSLHLKEHKRLTPHILYETCACVDVIHTINFLSMFNIRGHIQTICEKINVIMTLTSNPPPPPPRPPLASYRTITFMKVERLQSITLLGDSIPTTQSHFFLSRHSTVS